MKKSKLIFATHNVHKLEEVKHILSDQLELLSLTDMHCYDEIPEEEDTLEGNARFKAKYIFNQFQLNCFSDDTGLEVDALDGTPGVHSARYASEEGHDDKANRTKLLKELQDKPNRKARFRTVVALWWNNIEYLFEGVVEGSILEEERGVNGFGYDSLFVPVGYEKTFAEMSEQEKNCISHRGLAIQKLSEFLEKQL